MSACIYRDGCQNKSICDEVGHCTSATRTDLDAEKMAADVASKTGSLQQRAMSFLSALVNTRQWNYAQAYDLAREMLDAKWNERATNSLKCVSAGCTNNCERGNPYLCAEHARPASAPPSPQSPIESMTPEKQFCICGSYAPCVVFYGSDECIRVCAQCLQKKLALLNDSCTRSHPHEDMNEACVLRAEIARLQNRLSHAEHHETPTPQATVAQQCPDCENAFRALASYGIPRERARSVCNGIQVLMTRMHREKIESTVAETPTPQAPIALQAQNQCVYCGRIGEHNEVCSAAEIERLTSEGERLWKERDELLALRRDQLRAAISTITCEDSRVDGLNAEMDEAVDYSAAIFTAWRRAVLRSAGGVRELNTKLDVPEDAEPSVTAKCVVCDGKPPTDVPCMGCGELTFIQSRDTGVI